MSSLLEQFRQSSHLSGGNAAYVDELYEQWLANPAAINGEWGRFFESLKARSRRHVEVSFASAAPPREVFERAGLREVRREASTLEFELQGEVDPLLKALAPYHVIDLRTEQATLDEILVRFYEKEAVR